MYLQYWNTIFIPVLWIIVDNTGIPVLWLPSSVDPEFARQYILKFCGSS